MPDIHFNVESAHPARHTAAPALNLRLSVNQRGEALAIQCISLQCQIRIDTTRRHYAPAEQAHLKDLFGAPERWHQTLHSMLWTHTGVVVPAFDTLHTAVDLPVPCSFDFNLAATKYFYGLADGEVPLLLLYSGSVFYRDDEGALAMDLISWHEESRYNLPVQVWRNMMDLYYPNQNWLCVNRKVFDAINSYKVRQGYTNFDEALNGLLQNVAEALS
ncbi:DUF6084 family protein [Marinobacter caseinilyticus]|uniref:DUF6084 family protein n=1 Tax=Marinobacter caseinilyticus TaxID=2692195 RepID=UPI00140806F4|nr:DUF6084 family protein [Marinobacter caseinilyticus]